jgi:hypothetical protein
MPRCGVRSSQRDDPAVHEGTKMKTNFTALEARQTIAHSLSCGKEAGHFASPGRGGRTLRRERKMTTSRQFFMVGMPRCGVRSSQRDDPTFKHEAEHFYVSVLKNGIQRIVYTDEKTAMTPSAPR